MNRAIFPAAFAAALAAAGSSLSAQSRSTLALRFDELPASTPERSQRESILARVPRTAIPSSPADGQ